MIRIDPIVRGESKLIRLTFLDADTEEAINCTGWTLHLSLGKSRSSLGDILTVDTLPTVESSLLGQVVSEIPALDTAEIKNESVIVELSVSTSVGGQKIPLLLAQAIVQSPENYRSSYYKAADNGRMLLSDVPTVVQDGVLSKTETINVSFSTNIDPTFDLGVMVKFDEPSTGTINLINAAIAEVEAKRLEVVAKHAEVMGAP